MTMGGWIIMGISIGGVLTLFSWCISRILRSSGESEHLHGFEVEPPDEAAEKHR